VAFLCGSCVSPRPVSSLVTSPLNAEMVESDDMGVVMHTQVPGPWVKCDKLRRCSLHCSERVTQRVWALSRLSKRASQNRSKVYFVHYLCTVYLSALSPTSPTKEVLHTGTPLIPVLSLFSASRFKYIRKIENSQPSCTVARDPRPQRRLDLCA
jgi:hypothetical protein